MKNCKSWLLILSVLIIDTSPPPPRINRGNHLFTWKLKLTVDPLNSDYQSPCSNPRINTWGDHLFTWKWKLTVDPLPVYHWFLPSTIRIWIQHFLSRKFWGYTCVMDKSAHLADLLVQIATEEASLAKLQNIKETLQNEVETTWDKLEKLQGVNRKQQFKHAQPQEETNDRKEN